RITFHCLGRSPRPHQSMSSRDAALVVYFCAAIVRSSNRIAEVNLTFHSHCGALRTRSVKPNHLQPKLQTFVNPSRVIIISFEV
ncbi:MAG: hypothetical protein ACTS53_01780, partial [Candidatus Hodgkinia cicadicola]